MVDTVKKTTKKAVTPKLAKAEVKPVKAVTKKVAAPKTATLEATTPVVAPETPVVKSVTKKTTAATTKQPGLSIDVFGVDGKVVETMTLPANVFGAAVNKVLIAQAVRVYLANQRRGSASTKTRGQVDGSTRKIYRQKGTGRARHGGIRAPIFVKGGIAHGPKKEQNFELHFPKKMRAAAFASALSARLHDGAITVVSGVSTLGLKTKAFAGMFDKLSLGIKGRSALLVLPKHMADVYKSARNLSGVDVVSAEQVNTYEVLAHKKLIIMKEAIEVFAKEHTK